MPDPPARLKFEALDPISRSEAEAAIAKGAPEELGLAALRVALHDDDWSWAQQYCLALATHPDPMVRGNAIQGLSHIARLHGSLDVAVVRAAVLAGLSDSDESVRGQADEAADDIEVFLGVVVRPQAKRPPGMALLLEGPCAMPYYTDLRHVFRAIDGRQLEFNWLISDLTYSWLGPHGDAEAPPFTFGGSGPYWRTGQELTRLVAEHEMQFDWAVLSGFAPGVSLDLSRLEIEPYADGNPGFWADQPRIQHPLAEIEIVCWDSGSTLLLCRDRSIGESFRRAFPEAIDLVEYNKARRTNR